MSLRVIHEHQRVGWFELFYDLVIVATVGYAAHSFAHHPTWTFGFWICAWVLIMFVLWSLTTINHNLFPGDYTWRRLLGLAQMMALVVGALGMVADEGLSSAAGFGGMGVAFACGTALYVVPLVRGLGDRRTTWLVATSAAAGSIVLLGGMALRDPVGWGPTDRAPYILAVGVGLVAVGLFVAVGRLPALGDDEHLTERLGQLVIIVLGETFVSLMSALGGKPEIPNPLFMVLTFVVVFAVWSLYFSSVVPAGMPSRPWRLRAWYVIHWPLMFGAVGAAAGFSMVMLVPFGDERSETTANWTTAPLAFVMVAVAVLTWIGAGRITAQVRIHLSVVGMLVVLAVVDEFWTKTAANWEIAAGAVVVAADAYVSRRIDAERVGPAVPAAAGVDPAGED
jgi:low temperature requirement protein LtrA